MAWNLTASASPKLPKMSNKPAGDQVLGMVSPSNRGFRSLVDGGSPVSSGGSPKPQLHLALDQQEGTAEEDTTNETLQQVEKKRRLSPAQVKYLEMSFGVENKLEPDRKSVIAKELGLEPRQVAVWFQNKRARWKTKQLEQDYDALKADYNAILQENEQLKAEVCRLTEKLRACYEERKGEGVVKNEAMDEGEDAMEGVSRQGGGGGGEDAISSKETESEQSEVVDSANSSIPPPPLAAAPAATATFVLPPAPTATLVLPAAPTATLVLPVAEIKTESNNPAGPTATLVLPVAEIKAESKPAAPTATLVLPFAEIKGESNSVVAAAAFSSASSSSLAHLLVSEESVVAACEDLFGDCYNPLLFQHLAVKLDPFGGGGGGAVFAAEDRYNLFFSVDESNIFPWFE